jgi:putative transposase
MGHPRRISHSDAGSQYTSIRFTEHLALEGIKPSVGTVGDAFDKALMETIIGLFKTECIGTTIFHPGPFRTLADVEFAVVGWVDWYNHRRLHSSLGVVPPVEIEQAHYAAVNPVGSIK